MRCEEAIRSRRSVRRYASDRVSEDTLRSIIEAGIRAPSGLIGPVRLIAFHDS